MTADGFRAWSPRPLGSSTTTQPAGSPPSWDVAQPSGLQPAQNLEEIADRSMTSWAMWREEWWSEEVPLHTNPRTQKDMILNVVRSQPWHSELLTQIDHVGVSPTDLLQEVGQRLFQKPRHQQLIHQLGEIQQQATESPAAWFNRLVDAHNLARPWMATHDWKEDYHLQQHYYNGLRVGPNLVYGNNEAFAAFAAARERSEDINKWTFQQPWECKPGLPEFPSCEPSWANLGEEPIATPMVTTEQSIGIDDIDLITQQTLDEIIPDGIEDVNPAGQLLTTDYEVGTVAAAPIEAPEVLPLLPSETLPLMTEQDIHLGLVGLDPLPPFHDPTPTLQPMRKKPTNEEPPISVTEIVIDQTSSQPAAEKQASPTVQQKAPSPRPNQDPLASQHQTTSIGQSKVEGARLLLTAAESRPQPTSSVETVEAPKSKMQKFNCQKCSNQWFIQDNRVVGVQTTTAKPCDGCRPYQQAVWESGKRNPVQNHIALGAAREAAVILVKAERPQLSLQANLAPEITAATRLPLLREATARTAQKPIPKQSTRPRAPAPRATPERVASRASATTYFPSRRAAKSDITTTAASSTISLGNPTRATETRTQVVMVRKVPLVAAVAATPRGEAGGDDNEALPRHRSFPRGTDDARVAAVVADMRPSQAEQGVVDSTVQQSVSPPILEPPVQLVPPADNTGNLLISPIVRSLFTYPGDLLVDPAQYQHEPHGLLSWIKKEERKVRHQIILGERLEKDRVRRLGPGRSSPAVTLPQACLDVTIGDAPAWSVLNQFSSAAEQEQLRSTAIPIGQAARIVTMIENRKRRFYQGYYSPERMRIFAARDVYQEAKRKYEADKERRKERHRLRALAQEPEED